MNFDDLQRTIESGWAEYERKLVFTDPEKKRRMRSAYYRGAIDVLRAVREPKKG